MSAPAQSWEYVRDDIEQEKGKKTREGETDQQPQKERIMMKNWFSYILVKYYIQLKMTTESHVSNKEKG